MTVLGTILLIILILVLIGSLPTWPYSAGWGYDPSSGLGLILVIVLSSFSSAGSKSGYSIQHLHSLI